MQLPQLPPIPSHYTRTVAERSFTGRNAAGEFSVRVELGEPIQDVETVNGFDWRCPMRITVGTAVEAISVMGIDSLQALQLAMGLARSQLERIATRRDTVLSYLDCPIDTSQTDWQQTLL